MYFNVYVYFHNIHPSINICTCIHVHTHVYTHRDWDLGFRGLGFSRD